MSVGVDIPLASMRYSWPPASTGPATPGIVAHTPFTEAHEARHQLMRNPFTM